MAAESASPASPPLSKTAAWAWTGGDGREAAGTECKFGREAQAHAGSRGRRRRDDSAGESLDEALVGANGERSLQGGNVQFCAAGLQQGPSLQRQVAGALAQLGGARRRRQAAPGAHQQRVERNQQIQVELGHLPAKASYACAARRDAWRSAQRYNASVASSAKSQGCYFLRVGQGAARQGS
jgi:hypothetical protein